MSMKIKNEKMTSEIHWQTGTPTIPGAKYIITDKHSHIGTDYWSGKQWLCYNNEDVLAWCLLVDVNPYNNSYKPIEMKNTIKINEDILNYINNYKPPFEFIPKLGSLWKIEQEVSYPNVNGGYPVIELSNSKGEWLRLPKCIINNERTKI